MQKIKLNYQIRKKIEDFHSYRQGMSDKMFIHTIELLKVVLNLEIQ